MSDGRRRRVSDAEYFARYLEGVRWYVRRANAHARLPHNAHWPLLAEPCRFKNDSWRVAEWEEYARLHGGLKAMNPDGTWRPWSPLELEPDE